MYNAYETAKLAGLAPGFDWTAFMAGAGLGKVTHVVAQENTAFPKIAAIYARTPMATLKAWQAFSLADQAGPYLAKPFVDTRFAFRGTVLNGQPAQRPRWKRGVQAVDGQIGEALGKVYVDEYFPPQSKAKMLALVSDIQTAMKGRIEHLDWMSAPTKAKALEKLSKFTVKIGYPDKWRDYSGLTIKADDLYGNINRASTFDWDFRVGRLGGPVDRSRVKHDAARPSTPTTTRPATRSSSRRPDPAAALLFDLDGDMAINYGGIGGAIGHELTHGFDDSGPPPRRDGQAHRLQDCAEDAAKFEAQAKKLGAQYAAFEVLPGAKINGELTMGENIADLGGAAAGARTPITPPCMASRPRSSTASTRRPAGAPGLGAGVARQDPRRRHAPAAAPVPIRTRRRTARVDVPMQQHRRLLHGLRAPGRRRDVHRPGGSGSDLVTEIIPSSLGEGIRSRSDQGGESCSSVGLSVIPETPPVRGFASSTLPKDEG